MHCWKNATDKDVQSLQLFIKDCYVIELEQSIKIKTAEIRKEYGLKLPDSIIAASALVYELVLLTRNMSDFNKISGLQIINP